MVGRQVDVPRRRGMGHGRHEDGQQDCRRHARQGRRGHGQRQGGLGHERGIPLPRQPSGTAEKQQGARALRLEGRQGGVEATVRGRAIQRLDSRNARRGLRQGQPAMRDRRRGRHQHADHRRQPRHRLRPGRAPQRVRHHEGHVLEPRRQAPRLLQDGPEHGDRLPAGEHVYAHSHRRARQVSHGRHDQPQGHGGRIRLVDGQDHIP